MNNHHDLFISNNNLIEINTNKIILQYPTEKTLFISDDIINNNNNIIIEFYGGKLITLFNYQNKWFSLIDNNINDCILNEFNEIINGLNPDYYYLFMLNNNTLIKKYHKFNLIYIKQKYDFIEINIEQYNLYKQKRLVFTSSTELHACLSNISSNNIKSTKITMEGFIIFTNNTFVKIQTECYRNIIKLKPKNPNIHIGYLELYQQNQLLNYLPFESEYSVDILKRISISLKTISEEILNLYYFVNKSRDIVNILPDIYKKIINDINHKYTTKINIHHVYYYIKNLNINYLIDVYKNRHILDNNFLFDKIINKNCVYTKTQIYFLSK